MIYGFAAAEVQFMDSSVYGFWTDADNTPVSARNYAHEVFRYDEELSETPENILDELDDYFVGRNNYRVVPHDDGVFNMAEAIDTESAWPFVVRRRVILIQKKYVPREGWVESPSPVPVIVDLLQDCD